MLESRNGDAVVDSKSHRAFGLMFAAVFLLIALYPLIRGEGIRIWSLLAAGVLFGLGLFAPRTLAVPSRLWLKFGEILHRIVSPVVLGVIFFGAILPFALVMRLAGRDALRRKFDGAAATYWLSRESPAPAPESFRNQF